MYRQPTDARRHAQRSLPGRNHSNRSSLGNNAGRLDAEQAKIRSDQIRWDQEHTITECRPIKGLIEAVRGVLASAGFARMLVALPAVNCDWLLAHLAVNIGRYMTMCSALCRPVCLALWNVVHAAYR